jgi:hypothetical protein
MFNNRAARVCRRGVIERGFDCLPAISSIDEGTSISGWPCDLRWHAHFGAQDCLALIATNQLPRKIIELDRRPAAIITARSIAFSIRAHYGQS